MEYAMVSVINTPWERLRARRVNRLVAHAAIDEAARELWQRARGADIEIRRAEQSTPLASALLANPQSYVANHDHNELTRRALIQVFAIRIWQLRHGGQFPERLDQLVPELLPSLPSDPYSGRNPFGYIRSTGQLVAPIDEALFPSTFNTHRAIDGSWLLYSVGYNFRDDGGTAFRANYPLQTLDLVFEIPPIEGGGARSDE
jgi:hypothetical protein